LKGYKFSDVHE